MITRYSRKELTTIWSEENKYKIWLDVEIAAAQAMEKYKFIQELNENADRLLLNAELMDLESYSEQALIEADMDLEDLSSKVKTHLNGSK